MNLNRVFLYGNLTRDPELKALPSGQNVVNFSIATNRTYKDRDGAKKEQVEYHNVVAFGRQADLIAQYMKKGRPILVEGRLQTRSWEAEGKKNYRTEIIVENFQFGAGGGQGGGGYEGGSRGGSSSRSSAPAEAEDMGGQINYPDEEINPEDIPF
mgnify:CR=1 FL=1